MTNKEQLSLNNSALDGYIERVIAAKDVAASLPNAGGGLSDVPTCTIEIVNETIGVALMESYINGLWFVAYENGEYVGYGGYDIYSDYNRLPADFDFSSERIVLNNVVCGSMMCITDILGMLNIPESFCINVSIDSSYILVPLTPGATHTFKLEGLG